MSDAIDAAVLNMMRHFDRLSPADQSLAADEVCAKVLRRISAEARGFTLRHIGHVFRSRALAANDNGSHAPPGSSHLVQTPIHTAVQTAVQIEVWEGGPGGGFLKFWSLYPRKQNKLVAEKAFKKLNPNKHLLDVMLAGIERGKQSDQWRRGAIPLGSTFINEKRWEDTFEHERGVQFEPSVHLDAPIEWRQPGSLMRLWNDHTPAECDAVVTADPDRVANEQRALIAYPEIAYWLEVCDQITHSRKLRAKVPTDQGGLAHALDFDRLLSVDGRYGVTWAVRVHDGHYRDG